MDDGLTLVHIRGIEIRLSWSVVVIVALVTWSLAVNTLPDLAEGYGDGAYWGVAALLAVALLAGLVAHELGHSIIAAREGVGVSSITLWMFGGVARLESQPKTARSAGRIAIAGPAVSSAIGVAALAVAPLFDGLTAAAIAWYGVINLALAVFNLLPAFPMDGGRMYQAWWWARTQDQDDATRRAVSLGRTMGAIMIGLGALEALSGAAVGGVWLILIGWFVREAARAELDQITILDPLGKLRVTQVMTADPESVVEADSLESFVSDSVLGGRHTTYPVVSAGGLAIGLVNLDAVRTIDRERWATTTVGEVTSPLADVLTIDVTASVADVMQLMAGDPRRRTLVFDGTRLAGIVAPADLARLVAAVQLAGPDAFVKAS
jgi:Zn-dependent protease